MAGSGSTFPITEEVQIPSTMSTDAFPSTSNEEATMAKLAKQVDVENNEDDDMTSQTAQVDETQLKSSRLSVPPKHFERPKSSHEDAGAGFTFGKPAAWNGMFNRHFKSALSIAQEDGSTPPSAQPRPDLTTKESKENDHLPHIVNGNVITPFPNVGFGTSVSKNNPPATAEQSSFSFSSAEKTQVQSLAPATQNAMTQPSTQSEFGTPLAGPLPTAVQPTASAHALPPSLTQSDFGTPLTGNLPTAVQPTQAQFEFAKPAPKIQSPPAANNNLTPVQPSTANRQNERSPIFAKDYFRTYNAQQYQLQEQTLQRVLRELEHSQYEVSDLDDKLNTLSEAYKKLQADMKAKDASIANNASEKQSLQAKAQKLQDFVNGLGNDYNRLRESTRSLQAQRDGLNAAEKEELARCQTLTAKYKGQVDSLQQMINVLQHQQNTRSPVKPNTLALEQLDKVATDLYLKLRDDLSEQCSQLGNKLESLTARHSTSQAVTVATPVDCTPKVDKCLHLLQDLLNRDHVRPQHIKTLDENIRGYARSIDSSLQKYQSQTSQSTSLAQRIAENSLKELNSLRSSTASTSTLQEQVIEYREQKASSLQKAHNLELQLAEARCKVSSMQEKLDEKSASLQAMQLEVATARARPQEAPELLLRISDLQTACKDVEAQKTAAEKRVQKLAQQVKDKQTAIERIEGDVSGFQLQVEAATAREQELRKEQARMIEDFERQKQADRTVATKAAESRFTKLNDQFMNERMQAKAELEAANEELEALKEQLVQLTKDDGAQTSKSKKLELALAKVQNELAQALQTQAVSVQRQQAETEASKATIADLQTQLDEALTEKEKKAKQLLAMRALSITTSRPKTVLEDSQDYGVAQLQELSRDNMSDCVDEPDLEFAHTAISKAIERPAIGDSQAVGVVASTPKGGKSSIVESAHFAQQKPRETLTTPIVNRSSQGSQATPKRPLKQTHGEIPKRVKMIAQPQLSAKSIADSQSPANKAKVTLYTKTKKKTISRKEEKMKRAFQSASQEK